MMVPAAQSAGPFHSALTNFLTLNAQVGLYPTHFASGGISYGLSPEDLGSAALPLRIPGVSAQSGARPFSTPDASKRLMPVRLFAEKHGMRSASLDQVELQGTIDAAAIEARGAASSRKSDSARMELLSEMAGALTDEAAPETILRAGVLNAARGDDRGFIDSGNAFLAAAESYRRDERHFSAALLMHAAKLVFEGISTGAHPDAFGFGRLAAQIRGKEIKVLLESLRRDPDPATYGFRIFMGMCESWRMEEWTEAAEGIMIASALWNMGSGRPLKAAADMARMAWRISGLAAERDSEHRTGLSQALAAAAAIWGENGEDELSGQANSLSSEAVEADGY